MDQLKIKLDLKKNSLFGTEVTQTQDTIEHFCEKIRAGREARVTSDFMIINWSLREITNDEIIYLKSILWYMYWGGDSIHGEITG